MIERTTQTEQTTAEPIRTVDVAPAPEAAAGPAISIRRAVDAALGSSFSAPPVNPRVQRSDVAQLVENKTGMPDALKTGIESLSGFSMDEVKVHYNSSKPAELQAHAFAQGTNIHLGPGQEKHLPHEAWHVVQQKQGRVAPTVAVNGAPINDDPSLEAEAAEMGEKAARGG